MSCRGLPMAMTARRRPARPNSATNFPSWSDPSAMTTSSSPEGLPMTWNLMSNWSDQK